jgi:Protein tyrosine and serine/threonine kinase
VFRGTIETFEEELPVAIKKFPTIISDSDFKDFQREAKIMKKLEHKNIVKIYEFCEEPLLIIMEYMSYGTILTYLSINRPNLTVENILHFASNIAEVCENRFRMSLRASLTIFFGFSGDELSGAAEYRASGLSRPKHSRRERELRENRGLWSGASYRR